MCEEFKSSADNERGSQPARPHMDVWDCVIDGAEMEPQLSMLVAGHCHPSVRDRDRDQVCGGVSLLGRHTVPLPTSLAHTSTSS